MRKNLVLPLLFSLALCSGCVSEAQKKSVESLDEITGMTWAALMRPIAFVETGIYDPLAPAKQPSIVYLGPEEWDRSGDYTYVLWMQLAPGVDGHRIDDIRARGAVVLKLDDGPLSLAPLEQPVRQNDPYGEIAPVGQRAYFAIDVAQLKRIASSRKILVNLRAGDLTMVDFLPQQATRDTLQQFIVERSIGND